VSVYLIRCLAGLFITGTGLRVHRLDFFPNPNPRSVICSSSSHFFFVYFSLLLLQFFTSSSNFFFLRAGWRLTPRLPPLE